MASDTPPVAVSTAQVVREDLTQWQFAEGTVQATRKAYLQFETAGRIAALGHAADGGPLREGARVAGPSADGSPGKLLARLDAGELTARVAQARADLAAASQRLAAAEAGFAQARAELARQRSLADRNLISTAAADAAETAFRTLVA